MLIWKTKLKKKRIWWKTNSQCVFLFFDYLNWKCKIVSIDDKQGAQIEMVIVWILLFCVTIIYMQLKFLCDIWYILVCIYFYVNKNARLVWLCLFCNLSCSISCFRTRLVRIMNVQIMRFASCNTNTWHCEVQKITYKNLSFPRIWNIKSLKKIL